MEVTPPVTAAKSSWINPEWRDLGEVDRALRVLVGSPCRVRGVSESDTDTADLQVHRALGLTDEEAADIESILGRTPNHLELAMYAVMSVSYTHLTLPTICSV